MTQQTNIKFVSDFKLEQYTLGELDNFEMQSIDEALKVDLDLLKRLNNLKESNEQILSDYPVRKTAAEINWRSERQSKSQKSSFMAWLSPAAASCAVILVLFSSIMIYTKGIMPAFLSQGDQEIIYTKGLEPQINIHLKHENGSSKLLPGALVKEGDALQISYIAGGAKYGMLFSIDGSGMITVHLPEVDNKKLAAKLDKEGEIALPFAYELDDAPKFERFFFISSDTQFKIAKVMDQANKLKSRIKAARTEHMDLPEDLSQKSLLLIKSTGE